MVGLVGAGLDGRLVGGNVDAFVVFGGAVGGAVGPKKV